MRVPIDGGPGTPDHVPGLLRGLARDDVEANGGFDAAAVLRGELLHSRELDAQLLARLEVREIEIGVLTLCGERGVGRPHEVELRPNLSGERGRQLRVFHAVELTLVAEAAPVPNPLEDVQELGGSGVSVVVGDAIAPPELLRSAAARDDVEEESAVREPSAGSPRASPRRADRTTSADKRS